MGNAPKFWKFGNIKVSPSCRLYCVVVWSRFLTCSHLDESHSNPYTNGSCHYDQMYSSSCCRSHIYSSSSPDGLHYVRLAWSPPRFCPGYGRRVFLAPSQNRHSAGKSEAVVDTARTNHLAVFDIATNLRRLNIGAWRLNFSASAARVSLQ